MNEISYKAKRILPMVCMMLLVTMAAGAQDTGSDVNLDSLFGGDIVESASTTATDAAAAVNPVTAALKTDKVRIGGSFYGSLSAGATWTNLWDGSSYFFNADSTALDLALKSTLFFDARPTEDFRVYGSAKTNWPFVITKTFLTGASYMPLPTPSVTTTSDTITAPNISLFELFADFSLNDKAFFRFGKSTVKWGVGYFWSPADVINLEPINLLDATAQREGPINFRVNIPVFGTQNNFYLYTILDKDTVAFSTTALAAKAEFLLGSYELGLGAYYRNDTAERAMMTLTGPVGNFDVFGEAMVSRGSAKTFVTGISGASPYDVVTTGTADNRQNLYFSASTGFMYSSQKDYFTAIGQYYYNGEGYSNDNRKTLVADAQAALLAHPTLARSYMSALANLAYGSGQHYAAVSLSKSELFFKDLSASALVIANLSDGSGIVKPSVSWAIHDNFTLTLSPMFVFGPADGEYAFLAGGDLVSLSLSAIVSGSF